MQYLGHDLCRQLRQGPGGEVQGRVQFQGLFEHERGLLAVAQPLQIDPQVGVVDGRARVQFDDLLEAGHRLLIILQLEAAKTQEVVGLLEVWVQFQGPGEGLGGLLEVTQVFLAGAQMDVDAGQFDGPAG